MKGLPYRSIFALTSGKTRGEISDTLIKADRKELMFITGTCRDTFWLEKFLRNSSSTFTRKQEKISEGVEKKTKNKKKKQKTR